jgi:hypothetical protein
MKKFFTFVALIGMSVSVVQCMEPDKKDLTMSFDDRVFAVDPRDPRTPKKQKTKENSAVVNNAVADKDAAKALVCSYCEVRFLTKNNLTAHQTFSYCAKKLQEKKSS